MGGTVPEGARAWRRYSREREPGYACEERGEIEVLDVFVHGEPPLRWKALGSEG